MLCPAGELRGGGGDDEMTCCLSNPPNLSQLFKLKESIYTLGKRLFPLLPTVGEDRYDLHICLLNVRLQLRDGQEMCPECNPTRPHKTTA